MREIARVRKRKRERESLISFDHGVRALPKQRRPAQALTSVCVCVCVCEQLRPAQALTSGGCGRKIQVRQ